MSASSPPVPGRTLTPSEKLQTAMRIYWSARALKRAAFAAANPDWSPEQLDAAVRDAFLFRHG
jgi:hypothetical protein